MTTNTGVDADDEEPVKTVLKRKATENRSSPTSKESPTSTPKRLRISTSTQSTKASTPSHLSLLENITAISPTTPPTPTKTTKTSRRQRINTDPRNVSIYTLRKEGLGWDEIASQTNQDCGLSGDNELTAAACYSRFIRNGPSIAQTKGEEFKKDWYVHMKGNTTGSLASPNGESGEEDSSMTCGALKNPSKAKQDAVLQAVQAVRNKFWANVTAAANDLLGDKDNNGMTEENVKALYDRIKDGGS